MFFRISQSPLKLFLLGLFLNFLAILHALTFSCPRKMSSFLTLYTRIEEGVFLRSDRLSHIYDLPSDIAPDSQHASFPCFSSEIKCLIRAYPRFLKYPFITVKINTSGEIHVFTYRLNVQIHGIYCLYSQLNTLYLCMLAEEAYNGSKILAIIIKSSIFGAVGQNCYHYVS